MNSDIDKLLNKRENNIDRLINKYSDELSGYKYIEHINDFSTLRLKGNIRYINKYDEKLRIGGHLIKIINNNNSWYALLLQPNKKYYVSFSSNYIFYQVSKEEQFRKWAECFITDVDKGLYDTN